MESLLWGSGELCHPRRRRRHPRGGNGEETSASPLPVDNTASRHRASPDVIPARILSPSRFSVFLPSLQEVPMTTGPLS